MAAIDNGLPEMPKPSQEELAAWTDWVADRPEPVRETCVRLPPWHYYDMPKTRQIVVIEAYNEDGTLRVTVVGDAISIPAVVSFEVFGVKPEDLVRRPEKQ